MKPRRISIIPLIVAFLTGGLGTFLASFFLETFLFRPVVKAVPALFPWNRELNALSLILAAICGGAGAARLARSSTKLSVALPAKLRRMLTQYETDGSLWSLIFAAAGAVTTLWILRHVVAYNPLTVGWRGYLMTSAGAAAGGSLITKGRVRWIAWLTMLITLIVGFGTVHYGFFEFQVIIPSERALLRGQVTVPGRRAGVAYPGVLLVHDLGCHDRNETWGVNHPFRELAEHLALNGYVVLRYDKRGCGASSGTFTRYGLQDFARDAGQAAEVFARQQEVKGGSLYAVGHGYGGQAITIAALASPDRFAGLALLSTPASAVSDWLLSQKRYELTALDASPAEVDARLAAVEDWIDGVRNRRYLNYGDYFGSQGLSDELQTEQHVAPLPPEWLNQAMDYDQSTALATTRMPVLILAGGADWRVPPAEAELLAAALAAAGRSDWDKHVLPGINHHLVAVQSMETGFLLEQMDNYTKERRPVSSAALDALTDWLDESED